MPPRGRERGVAREERRAERFGEGDVRGVVGGESAPKLPDAARKRGVGIACQGQIEEVFDGLGRP